MQRQIAILCCLGFAIVPAAIANKCYALAFSGGGDRGSFEAGVVKGLVERLPAEERQWNIMTGISAGSILASGGALFDIGDEVAMADFMVESTVDFTKDHVYKQWFPFGPLTGLDKTGFVNTEPLFNTLLGRFKTRGNRNFTIGATDDVTGRIVLFNESMVGSNVTRWATYVRASAAIPGIFESVKIDGLVLSDGGERLGIDVFSAVNRCRDLGVPDKDIVVDMITCDSLYLKPWDQDTDDKSLELFARGRTEKSYNQQMQDILDACLAYPNVDFRYYVEPPESGLPSNGITFNKEQMQEMVQIGLKQAAAAQPGAACIVAQKNRHSNMWPRAKPLVAPILV